MSSSFYQKIEHIVPSLKSPEYLPGERLESVIRGLKELQDYHPNIKYMVEILERLSLLDDVTLDKILEYYEVNHLMEETEYRQ